MATTNNIQGDKPLRSSALERRVQTLMAAVERLTQQNHDLEEQLRQRDVGHNVQENQEGNNIKERFQEGPKGNNALSKQEQLDVSHPSAVDMAPPHIVAKMQMIKELMDLMMNALRGLVSSDLDDLVHRTDSPFTTSVNSFPLPPKFQMPQVENYDENKDPLDYLKSFKTLMHIKGILNEIMCKAFPATLKGSIRIWFNRLTPNSISSFKELST